MFYYNAYLINFKDNFLLSFEDIQAAERAQLDGLVELALHQTWTPSALRAVRSWILPMLKWGNENLVF
jgi:hypothetical protein